MKKKNDAGQATPTAIAGGCLTAVIVGLLLMFAIGTHTVDSGWLGIVTTGGNVSGTVDPGYVHVWAPFQSVQFVDLRTQKVQFQQIDASSSELQSVAVDGTITYHVERDHAIVLYQRVGLDDLEPKIIQPALQDYVKEATVLWPAVQVLNHRADIRLHALTALNTKLAANYPGLVIDDIFLQNIGYSKAFNDAIEAKQASAQQVLQAQQVQDKAQVDAATALITAQGVANANAVLQQSLTPGVLQQHSIDKWDGHLPQFSGTGTPFINVPTAK